MGIARLLIPVKGERTDKDAMELASKLIDLTNGHIYVLYVIEVPREYPVDADLPKETAIGEKVLTKVEEFFQNLKISVTGEFLQARDLGPAVLKEVEERNIELVLFGTGYDVTHGVYSPGEDVTYLLKHIPCPIWVLREEIPSTTELPDNLDSKDTR